MNEEMVRIGVWLIKDRFLRYRTPPVELPAESVIEDTVRELYRYFSSEQTFRTL